MNEQSVLENEKISEKVKSADKPAIIKGVLFFLAGFSLSLLPEEFRVSPFCAAGVAASPSEYAFLTFLGGTIGYFATKSTMDAFVFAVLLGLVLATKSVLGKRIRTFSRTTVSIVSSVFFVFAVDIFKMLLSEVSAIEISLCVADAVMCAASVYFFSRSLAVPAFRLGLRKISGADAVCIVLSGAIILACIGNINIASIYPARIAAGLFVMFCASYRGVGLGSAVGVALGSVLALGGNYHVFFMYAFSSLICSVFAPMGQYAIAVSFAASATGAAILYKLDLSAMLSVIECAIAATAFVAIPSKKLSAAKEFLTKSGFDNDGQVNRAVALDLKSAAKTVEEVTDIVAKVTKRMDAIINPELSRVYAKIQRGVCNSCEKKEECWNRLFAYTTKDIEFLANEAMNNNRQVTALPNGLEKRCFKLEKLAKEIDTNYSAYVSQTDARIKIEEMRNVVADQFAFVAKLLDDVSRKIAEERVADTDKTEAITDALAENRISAQNVLCTKNASSRVCVEITLYKEPEKVDSDKIQRILTNTVGVRFAPVEISVLDFCTILTFRQTCTYEVSIGVAQIPFGENRVCGDSVETFDDANANTIAVISDGMGTGSRAAIDGTMTSSLMHKLLSSGFTFDSALALVNSALIIKSRDESLATVDAVAINTYNGVCTFYKAGAAQSYIRTGGGVQTVSQSSLPVGILREVSFAKEEAVLKNGDIVLLISDGVTGADDSWIEEELLSWSTDNMYELSAHIAQTAKRKNGIKYEDDISVVAMKIKKSKK